MLDLLSLFKEYSPEVAVLLIVAAGVLYFLKLVVDKSVAATFDTKVKELEFRLQRRSAFEDKVLADRFALITDFSARLEKVMTNLNRMRKELPVEAEFLEYGEQGRELVPLTNIYIDLEVHRLVLGEDFYNLFTRQAHLALKAANTNDENEWDALGKELVQLRGEIRSAVDAAFPISSFRW